MNIAAIIVTLLRSSLTSHTRQSSSYLIHFSPSRTTDPLPQIHPHGVACDTHIPLIARYASLSIDHPIAHTFSTRHHFLFFSLLDSAHSITHRINHLPSPTTRYTTPFTNITHLCTVHPWSLPWRAIRRSYTKSIILPSTHPVAPWSRPPSRLRLL